MRAGARKPAGQHYVLYASRARRILDVLHQRPTHAAPAHADVDRQPQYRHVLARNLQRQRALRAYHACDRAACQRHAGHITAARVHLGQLCAHDVPGHVFIAQRLTVYPGYRIGVVRRRVAYLNIHVSPPALSQTRL